jgi:transaldolase
VERYAEVIDAFLTGLEQRLQRRLPIDSVASVASFFVSRVDGKIDPQLDQKAEGASLRGKAAIANAFMAYRLFTDTMNQPRWKSLVRAGAQPQRPLWASTSTKDPRYSDTYYVEALVAPQTVNTVPPETLEAYRDHGKPVVRTREGMESAPHQLDVLAQTGIDLASVTRTLEEEGIEKFAASYRSLLAAIEAKIGQLV